MFEWLVVVANHFEHKSKADVNLIRTLEVGVDVEKLLKGFDGPGKKKKKRFSLSSPLIIRKNILFWTTFTTVLTTC